MNKMLLPTVISLAAACLLAACQEQSSPETVSTGAVPAEASPASAPAGPAPAPRLTIDAAYAEPEPFTFAADAVEGGVCALDAINGARLREATLPAGGDALFGGWAGNADKQLPADGLLVLRGTEASYAVPLPVGGARADVARAMGSEALATSGFNVPVRLAGVAPGTYGLVAVTDGATGAFCDLEATIAISE